jgi:hypothetical protein
MPDDIAGQIDPNAQTEGQPDPKAAEGTPKSAEEQLAELAAKVESLTQNSRKWETRAKENIDKAKKYEELQASSATDAEKLTAAEQRAAAAELRLTRYEVAARTNLPADLVGFLTAEDEDAMEEQAKTLLARLAPAKPAAPKPDPTQGGSGGKAAVSQAEIGRAAARARIERRTGKKS